MAHELIFPKLGQTAEEGAIVRWLKQEGDPVTKGDILFEIETDKANLEVESFFEGVLLKIYVKEGVTVPVNTVVGYVGAKGEKVPDQPPAPAVVSAPTAKPAPVVVDTAPAVKVDTAAAPAEAALATTSVVSAAPVVEPSSEGVARVVISPRARMVAREACIDPARVTGSGPGGRIVQRDIESFLESVGYSKIRITPAAKRLATKHEIDILGVRGSGDGGRIMVEDVERALRCKPVVLSRMRQVIARRLVESKQSIPHFYVTVRADITDLMSYRSELKGLGVSYSVNDFVLMAVALSLEEYPVVNSVTDGRSVSWRGGVDLGMAVSVENGLVVPVIRGAESLTMSELSSAARGLAERARAGKLTPDEMSGSSFTISNMGMLDVDQFTAIINPGESGILAVASARQEPAVVDGEIRVRTLMGLTLSVDHRIVDGAVGAAFINAIRSKLESVELWRTLV